MCVKLSKTQLLLKKLSIDALTDSDKLALWLHAFLFSIDIAGVNTPKKSSQNELRNEKQIKRLYLDHTLFFIRTSNFQELSAQAGLFLIFWRFQPQIVLKLFLFPDIFK